MQRMSLSQYLEEQVATVFMREDHFAKVITRYIGGDANNSTPITGIVGVQSVSIESGRGRGFLQDAELHLSSDTTLNEGDGIKYESERYEVKTIGATENGMRVASMVKYKPEVRGGKVFRNGDL